MTLAECVALMFLLAGFAGGIALAVWALLDDDGRWGGPGDDPAPGPSGRELVDVGR